MFECSKCQQIDQGVKINNNNNKIIINRIDNHSARIKFINFKINYLMFEI